MITREQIVRAFWAAFDAAAFDTAAGMMAPDAVVTWPCTGEVFRGVPVPLAMYKLEFVSRCSPTSIKKKR